MHIMHRTTIHAKRETGCYTKKVLLNDMKGTVVALGGSSVVSSGDNSDPLTMATS